MHEPNRNEPTDAEPHGSQDQPPAWPPPGVGLWLVLTLAVCLGIVLVSLFPFTFGAPTGPLLGMTNPGAGLLALQVVLFIPLGVLEGELARRVLHGWRAGQWSVLLIALDAALLALVCETLQYWLATRPSSIVDVIAAAFGGVAGYMLAAYCRGHPA